MSCRVGPLVAPEQGAFALLEKLVPGELLFCAGVYVPPLDPSDPHVVEGVDAPSHEVGYERRWFLIHIRERRAVSEQRGERQGRF